MKSLLTILVTTIVASAALAMPAYGASTYYADADAGDDANSCTSADEACKTIAGAKAKIVALDDSSNATLRLSGTFTEGVVFYATDVTAPNTLDGLHITANNSDVKPLIDGTGLETAVEVDDISSATVDYLKITGAQQGIVIGGSSGDLVGNIVVTNNSIYDIENTDDASAVSTMGVYAYHAKNLIINNNTINGVTAVLTNGTSYDYVYGIDVSNSSNVTVRYNTLSNITHTNTVAADSTFQQGIVYGIYNNNSTDVMVQDNAISAVSSTISSSVDSFSGSAYAYGISSWNGYDHTLRNNTISTVTATSTTSGDSGSMRSYVYGIELNSIQRHSEGNNLVRNNALSGFISTATGDAATSYVNGVYVSSVESLMVRNNTVYDLDIVGTSQDASGSAYGYVYAIYALNTPQGIIRNNTIADATNTLAYTQDSATSSGFMYGVYLSTAQNVTVRNNTVRDFAMVANNNNVSDFYDTGRIYGIYSYQGSTITLKKNIFNNFNTTYATSGEDGTSYMYHYGIYTYRSSGVTTQKNTYKNAVMDLTVNDPTASSFTYGYSYPFYFTDGSNQIVKGNKVINNTLTTETTTDNYLNTYLYAIELLDTPNSQVENNTVKNNTQTGTADTSVGATQYGIYLSRAPGTLVSDNTISGNTVQHDGAASGSAAYYGMYIDNSPQIYINANRLRSNAVNTASTEKAYGVYFYGDASKTYMMNNIVLGDADYDGITSYGVYLASSSTKKVYVLNNTVSDWYTAASLLGGSKLRLKNNILLSVGAGSYPLVVGADTVDMDSFQSNYNLIRNKTTSGQKVYDDDNSVKITWSDWTSKSSYSKDRKSINKAPKLKANGLLKKGSKAINKGTKKYGLAKKSLPYQLLQTDYNDTKRPLGKKVDIGADERKK